MTQAVADQRDYYTRTAAHYDAMHVVENDEHGLAIAAFAGLCQLSRPASILDVGAGTGRALEVLARRLPGVRLVGVEPVAALREIGHGRGIAQDQLIDGDALSLPFADDAFDYVIETGVLHHVPRPSLAVREMVRVARLGVMISDTNNYGQGGRAARTVKRGVRTLGLWNAWTWVQTRGRMHKWSKGDGVFYSYSVFDNLAAVTAKFPRVQIMNTTPLTGSDLRSGAGHVMVYAHGIAPADRGTDRLSRDSYRSGAGRLDNEATGARWNVHSMGDENRQFGDDAAGKSVAPDVSQPLRGSRMIIVDGRLSRATTAGETKGEGSPTIGRAVLRVLLPTRPGAFRLFLALAVFVSHVTRISVGPAAVFVFFVLSGYWMHRMWVGRYAATRRPYYTYLVSRAWRLLPVFLLIGLINIVVAALLFGSVTMVVGDPWWPTAIASVIILGYAALPTATQPLPPAWSLDIEARYYLIAPLLSSLAHRRIWLMLIVGGALVASVAASFIWATRTSLLAYISFFVMGLAAAQIDWRPSVRLVAGSAAVLVMTLLLVAILVPGALFGGRVPGPAFVWNPYVNIAVGVLAIPIALYTTRQPSDAVDRMMADMSYIVYLLHWPSVTWLTWLDRAQLAKLPFIPIAFAAVLGAAWPIWRWVDRPLNAARARWVSRRTFDTSRQVEREVAAP